MKQPLLVIWDGLRAHRSQLVRDYLDAIDGKIQIAFLPPYSPDLNPGEYLWARLQRHAMANYCPHDLAKRSECKVDVMRHFAKQGLMPAPPRTLSGQRNYSEAGVARVRFI